MRRDLFNPKSLALFELLLLTLRGELKNVLPAGKPLEIDGVSTPVDEVEKELDRISSPYIRARDQRRGWKQAVIDRKRMSPEAIAYVKKIRLAVAPILAGKVTELERLGFAVPKERRPLTAEEQVLAAEKGKETREKLHTLGPRQKEALLEAGGPVVVVNHDAVPPKPGNGVP